MSPLNVAEYIVNDLGSHTRRVVVGVIAIFSIVIKTERNWKVRARLNHCAVLNRLALAGCVWYRGQISHFATRGWIMVWEPWYSWEEHYFAAVLETDNAKLPERLDKAHVAIARRRQELDSNHGGTPEEQRELGHALHGLTVLKKERIDDCLGGYR